MLHHASTCLYYAITFLVNPFENSITFGASLWIKSQISNLLLVTLLWYCEHILWK